MEPKKRIQYLDIARGIAILLMIIGHCIYDRSTIAFKMIYSFHMPLFVIMSGYFFREKETIPTTLGKMAKLMLVTIGAWAVVYAIYYCCYHVDFTLVECVKVIFAMLVEPKKVLLSHLWFLPFLVCNKILFTCIFHLVRKLGKEKHTLILVGIVCLVLSIIGYLFGIFQWYLPFRLDVAMTCLFLTFLGYLAKKKELLPKLCKPKVILVLFPIWLCLVLVLPYTDIATRKYGFFGSGLFNAVCGTILVCALSKKIEEKLPKLTKGLAFCGKYSLFILVFNFIEYKVIFPIKYVEEPIRTAIIALLQIVIAIVATVIMLGLQEQIRNQLTRRKET